MKNAGLELLSEETESRWKIRLMKGSDEQNLLANDSSIKREDYLDLFHAAEKCKVKTEKLGPDGAQWEEVSPGDRHRPSLQLHPVRHEGQS